MEGAEALAELPPASIEAPPGLFFTKAAFFKYSALSRVKAAKEKRKCCHADKQGLPRPLGPLPGSLTSPGRAKAKRDAAGQGKDEATTATQDAVVPQLQVTDEGGSEELASDDIWGDEESDIFADVALPTAESAEPNQASSPPASPAKPATRAGAQKRRAASAAGSPAGAKRQRKQPKKASDNTGAKPAAKAAIGRDAKEKKPPRAGRKQTIAAAATEEHAEPDEASEAPSEMQAAKAEFMRTMKLPQPRAFSAASKGAAKAPVQRQSLAQSKQPGLKQAAAAVPAPVRELPQSASASEPRASRPLSAAARDSHPVAGSAAGARAAQLCSQTEEQKASVPARAIAKQMSESERLTGGHARKSEQKGSQAMLLDTQHLQQPEDLRDDLNLEEQEAGKPEESTKPLPVTGLGPKADGAEGWPDTEAGRAAPDSQHEEHDADANPCQPAAAGQPGSSAELRVPPAMPRLGQPLGGSGRPAENGVKLVNLLNPNNPQYDQAFALEYARMKAAACKDGAKGHKKRGPKRIYSVLTAQEHAWYLEKQGLSLRGRDAQRMADLSEKVAQEQQQFVKAQYLDAPDAERYRYMDPRVEAQLQAYFQPMRKAVRQLPGVWRLRGQLQLAELLKGPKQAPAMAHLSTPATSGQPQSFTPPPKHTAVPLDRSYMPSTDGSSSAAQLHEDATALRLAAEKRAAVVMADGAFSQLAQTAAPGAAAGWEIPVTVLPASQSSEGQQATHAGAVVLRDPLLKRALSRREKHELLFEHAIVSLGHERSRKQQQAQPGDWRKQLLEAMGGSAAVEPSQVQQLSGSASQPAASPLDASTAGELVSGEASLPGQTAGAPCTPPALRYSLWRLGEHRIITRAQIHAATQSSPGSEHSISTVVKAKMEHHGNKASDEEEVTPEELVRWWSATHVRPGAHALVCNVGAHSCQLLRSQGYTAHELLEVAVASGFTPALMWRLMSAILGQLTALAPGQYLLTHQPAARAICLFTASASAEQTAEEADVAPLPCMTDAPEGTVFDLWSAHTHSGATDESELAFIPKAWQQSDPDVPQITHTFCPRQPQANPGKRKGRKGNAKHAGSGTGAITGPVILDWDTEPKAAGGNDATFSAAKYAELLREDF